MARAPPGDYGGRHRRVRPSPRSLLQRRPPTCCCSVFPPFGFIRGVKVASVLLLLSYFGLFPVLVSLFLSHCFWRWGSHACLKSSPLIGRPWLLESIRPSGRTPISTRALSPFLSHSSFDEGMWFPLDPFGRPVFLYKLSMEIPLR